MKRTKEHNAAIGQGQKRAWDDGRRQRVPLGSVRVKDGVEQVKALSPKGWPYWRNAFQTEFKDEYTLDEARQLTASQRVVRRRKGCGVPYLYGVHLKGRKQSESHIENRRQAQRKYLFDLCSLDRATKQRIRKSLEYKRWRTAVFEKDNYTCQKCGARSGNGKAVYLEAHHIKSFTKYPKLRFIVENGITACRSCHRKIESKRMKGNNNGRRKVASSGR